MTRSLLAGETIGLVGAGSSALAGNSRGAEGGVPGSQVFKSYDQKDAVLAAGSGGNDDTQQVDGLVQGHGEPAPVRCGPVASRRAFSPSLSMMARSGAHLDGEMAAGAAQRIR